MIKLRHATSNAHFRFHGELAKFLPRERRETLFEAPFARAATLKNALEALGVPHTEVGHIKVNAAPATLDRIVREADVIEVFPWPETGTIPCGASPHFVADAHPGALARFLRMLGFDTVHHNTLTDAAIRRLAHVDRRIVLTRDRELLKCREIFFGCYVHALKPEEQLRAVVSRFGLAALARPFCLCLRCNLRLVAVSKEQVLHLLPETVARCQERFFRCGGCARVYWPGSHYARMRDALGRMLDDSIFGN